MPFRYSAWRFLVASILAAVVLVGVTVVIIAIVTPLNAANFWVEVPRALLTLAVGVLVTGGVASLLAAHNRKVEEYRNDHELRLQLVQELRDAHNKVKMAALLINASRSALVYGQQVQELLVARVSLLDVDWAVRSRPRLCGGDERVERISKLLRKVCVYLEAIANEYSVQYDRVHAIQLCSAKWNEKVAEELAAKRNPPTPVEISTSNVPWQELTRKQAFPWLTELREDTENHAMEFSKPLNEAIEIIITQDECRYRTLQM